MNKIVKIALLALFFGGVIFLLAAANMKVSDQKMDPPVIQLNVQDGISILNRKELMSEVYASGLYYKEMNREELNIAKVEQFLLHQNEIEKAEVYMGLNSKWYIRVTTKRPIARVIANGVVQFYIDEHEKIMKLSPYARPDILSFTAMNTLIPTKKVYNELINNDSLKTKLKLDQIYRISKYVCKDAFYNAQIEQIYYSPNDGFVLVPRVGEQEIIFGDATSDEEVKEKFKKLTVFYKDVIPYEGWNHYKSINLGFKDQIVATKR